MLLEAFVVNNPVFSGTTAEFVAIFRPQAGTDSDSSSENIRILTCTARICGNATFGDTTAENNDNANSESKHQAKSSWFGLSMLSTPIEQDSQQIFETDQLILLTDQVIDQITEIEFTCQLPETLPPTHQLGPNSHVKYILSIDFTVIDPRGSLQSGTAEMPLRIQSHHSVIGAAASNSGGQQQTRQTMQLKTKLATETKDIAKTLQTDVLELIDKYLIEDSLSPSREMEMTPNYESKIYKLEHDQELLAQIQLASPTTAAGHSILGVLEFQVPCHSAHFVLLANDEESICAQSISTVGQQKIGFSLPVPSYICQSFETPSQKLAYSISVTLFLASEEYYTCKQVDKTTKHSDEQYFAKPSVQCEQVFVKIPVQIVADETPMKLGLKSQWEFKFS